MNRFPGHSHRKNTEQDVEHCWGTPVVMATETFLLASKSLTAAPV